MNITFKSVSYLLKYSYINSDVSIISQIIQFLSLLLNKNLPHSVGTVPHIIEKDTSYWNNTELIFREIDHLFQNTPASIQKYT